MANRYIPLPDRRLLLSKSAGYCSKCRQICHGTDDESVVSFLGEICHIRGLKPDAARYDKGFSVDEINRYPNLILLCANCHKEVDIRSDVYTVKYLLETKKSHEEWVQQQLEAGRIESVEPVLDAIWRLPNCLQSIEQVLMKEVKEAKPMRPGKPVFADFEEGMVIWRASPMNHIRNRLGIDEESSRFGCALLSGESGVGKTTAALHLGYKISQEGWNVLYADCEETSLEGHDQSVTDYLLSTSSDSLLILDNVNSSPTAAKLILRGLERSKYTQDAPHSRVRLLMTARMSDSPRNPLKEVLRPLLEEVPTFRLELNATFVGNIITLILGETANGIGLDPNELIGFAGNDLLLIGLALQQVLAEGTIDWGTLSNFLLARMLDSLPVSLKKTGEILLLTIAVFSRNYCRVSISFLVERMRVLSLPAEMQVLDTLLREGHIVSSLVKREPLFGYPHAHLADIMLSEMSDTLVQVYSRALGKGIDLKRLYDELLEDYLKWPPPDLPLFVMNLSSSLLIEGKVSLAISIYEHIKQLTPVSDSLCIGITNLGLIMRAGGLVNKAKEAYEWAIELNPDLFEARVNLGNLLHDIGDLDRALETLGKACEIQPSDAFAHSARGSILADMERYDDAQAAHETALKLNELHPNIWNTYGSHLSDQGSLKEAERAFRKAIELHEGKIWIDPYTNLTKVLFRQGRNSEASEILDLALTMTPLSYIDFVDLGTLLLGFDRFEEANGMAEKALGLVPDGLEGIIIRSAALRALGQLELMKTVFDKMNEIESQKAASWSHVASCLHNAGLLPEAREAIDQAVELEPRNGEFRHEFAVVLMKEGDFDAAEREFKKAFKLGHKTEDCWIDRALSLRKDGKYKESERLLLDYLHENPDSSRAWFGIGLNRTSTNNNEGAAEAYAEAVKINPAYHEAWNNMGNSIRRLGRLEEAANAFEEAVKQKEDYARAWIRLADVLVEMCKWEEAEKAALSAFKADPSIYGFDIIMKKIQERRYEGPG